MSTVWRLSALLAVALLAGCCFLLRVEITLLPELAHIRVQVADAFSPLQGNLEQALARAGAREPGGKERSALLRISRNQMKRMPLSVGRTGRVQEYSMRYEVVMPLTDATGSVVVPEQEIALERSYQFETLRAQGTPGEEEVVRTELERDMTQAILRRIRAAVTDP